MRSSLSGVSPSRRHQIVPGALVAEGCMDTFGLTELEICPWALREGVILERLDQLSVLGGDRVDQGTRERPSRLIDSDQP